MQEQFFNQFDVQDTDGDLFNNYITNITRADQGIKYKQFTSEIDKFKTALWWLVIE